MQRQMSVMRVGLAEMEPARIVAVSPVALLMSAAGWTSVSNSSRALASSNVYQVEFFREQVFGFRCWSKLLIHEIV